MSFAYADPPYPGLARRYYARDPRCAEVDHRELVGRLTDEYQDGWALSTSARALVEVLRICPAGVRVACWVKGSRAGVSYRARNAYEPLIVFRGRARRMTCNEVLDDVLIASGRQHSHPGALVGMKPAPFAAWMFGQLGALRGDALADIFPGSGAITRAWNLYTSLVDARRVSV